MYKHNILNLFLIALLAVSCIDGHFPLVSREDYEASEHFNRKLTASLDSVQRAYARQNQDLAGILSELASVSNRTSRLRIGESMPISQIEEAREDLETIRVKISRLEKDAAAVRKLNSSLAVATRTIQDLKETVSWQESEINKLRTELVEKNQTIQKQSSIITAQNDTISSQVRSILKQKEALDNTVSKQKEMIYSAGVKLGEIADNGDFVISGRKNKEKLFGYRLSIYREALKYYQMAADEGHPAARDSVIALGSRLRFMEK